MKNSAMKTIIALARIALLAGCAGATKNLPPATSYLQL